VAKGKRKNPTRKCRRKSSSKQEEKKEYVNYKGGAGVVGSSRRAKEPWEKHTWGTANLILKNTTKTHGGTCPSPFGRDRGGKTVLGGNKFNLLGVWEQERRKNGNSKPWLTKDPGTTGGEVRELHLAKS